MEFHVTPATTKLLAEQMEEGKLLSQLTAVSESILWACNQKEDNLEVRAEYVARRLSATIKEALQVEKFVLDNHLFTNLI